MKKIVFLIFIISFFPSVVFAQLSKTTELVKQLINIVDILTVLAVSVALLFFFWGLAIFILKINGDEEAIKEGKQKMLWGILALFVIVSIWGIINFIGNQFKIDTTAGYLMRGGTQINNPSPGSNIFIPGRENSLIFPSGKRPSEEVKIQQDRIEINIGGGFGN